MNTGPQRIADFYPLSYTHPLRPTTAGQFIGGLILPASEPRSDIDIACGIHEGQVATAQFIMRLCGYSERARNVWNDEFSGTFRPTAPIGFQHRLQLISKLAFDCVPSGSDELAPLFYSPPSKRDNGGSNNQTHDMDDTDDPVCGSESDSDLDAEEYVLASSAAASTSVSVTATTPQADSAVRALRLVTIGFVYALLFPPQVLTLGEPSIRATLCDLVFGMVTAHAQKMTATERCALLRQHPAVSLEYGKWVIRSGHYPTDCLGTYGKAWRPVHMKVEKPATSNNPFHWCVAAKYDAFVLALLARHRLERFIMTFPGDACVLYNVRRISAVAVETYGRVPWESFRMAESRWWAPAFELLDQRAPNGVDCLQANDAKSGGKPPATDSLACLDVAKSQLPCTARIIELIQRAGRREGNEVRMLFARFAFNADIAQEDAESVYSVVSDRRKRARNIAETIPGTYKNGYAPITCRAMVKQNKCAVMGSFGDQLRKLDGITPVTNELYDLITRKCACDTTAAALAAAGFAPEKPTSDSIPAGEREITQAMSELDIACNNPSNIARVAARATRRRVEIEITK